MSLQGPLDTEAHAEVVVTQVSVGQSTHAGATLTTGGVSAVWLPPNPEGTSVPLPPRDPHHSTGSCV